MDVVRAEAAHSCELAQATSTASATTVAYQDYQKNLLRRQTSLYYVWLATVFVFGFAVEWLCPTNQRPLLHGERGSFWSEFFSTLLYGWIFEMRLALISMAPLVDDIVVTRVIVVWDLIVVLITRMTVVYYHGFEVLKAQNSIDFCMLVCQPVRVLIFAILCLWAVLAVSPFDAQRRMWLGLGFHTFSELAQWSMWTTYVAIQDHRLDWRVAYALRPLPLLYLVVRPRLRAKFQQKAVQCIMGQAATRSAANLSSLIETVLPAEPTQSARPHFKGIRSGLLLEVMTGSSPILPHEAHDTLAQRCKFGSCDAYISHSWYDDGASKQKALEAWSATFVKSSGREPLLWCDLCCADRGQPKMELRSLPIFLQGCKRLVVLCGPTYLSRLWSILEIFAHIHMGGSADDIELVQVLRQGQELEDAQAIEDAFDTFDARDCQCSDSDIHQQLLAIIHAAFGSVDAFNISVRVVIAQIKVQLPAVSVSATEGVAPDNV